MDETALFFRALPNKSMIQKFEEARGGKIPKERLTISFCVSAAGEKEKPLVIWRCQRPRCSKGKDLNRLGVSWYANKKAWMTSSIFEEWLLNFDKKKQGIKPGKFLCWTMRRVMRTEFGSKMSNCYFYRQIRHQNFSH
ncbi:hypothetical protein AVEN_175116-1 [Araneus ventricosus]|uniref:DDE-1 domain-containing protein n=1 Tax=Araneus ventricosus TaxID=182803 RepID=A0A4Y2B9P7_ARAVE|nr:hypothetical protein AVEN_175116-1 [Araneus ventricosus]